MYLWINGLITITDGFPDISGTCAHGYHWVQKPDPGFCWELNKDKPDQYYNELFHDCYAWVPCSQSTPKRDTVLGQSCILSITLKLVRSLLRIVQTKAQPVGMESLRHLRVGWRIFLICDELGLWNATLAWRSSCTLWTERLHDSNQHRDTHSYHIIASE